MLVELASSVILWGNLRGILMGHPPGGPPGDPPGDPTERFSEESRRGVPPGETHIEGSLNYSKYIKYKLEY